MVGLSTQYSLYIYIHIYAAAKLLQSYLTLCDPIDGSPPGSPEGNGNPLQQLLLLLLSRFSHVQLCATP